MDKKVIVIAEIMFAFVFIILMSYIFSHVTDFGRVADKNFSSVKEAISKSDLEYYNNKLVSGDTVIATINKLDKTKDGLKMSYAVCNGAIATSGNWKFYGYSGIAFDSTSAIKVKTVTPSASYSSYNVNAFTPTTAGYISPVRFYRANIVLNKNNVIVGIRFVLE